jgi:hypothetical protein
MQQRRTSSIIDELDVTYLPTGVNDNNKSRTWSEWLQIRVMYMFRGLGVFLAWLFPKWLGVQDTEGANKTKATTWVNKWAMTTVMHWKKIILFLFFLVGCVMVILFSGAISNYRDSFYRSAAHADALMKHCRNHGDRLRILREPAVLIPKKSITSGVLPCGSSLELMQKQLIELHRTQPPESYPCLTAKHLNHSYALISMKESSGSVKFFFNPDSESFAIVGNLYKEYNEISDFFPAVGVLKVERPMSAWLTVTDNSFVTRRMNMVNDTLACFLYAWDIISGDHYERYGLHLLAGNEK